MNFGLGRHGFRQKPLHLYIAYSLPGENSCTDYRFSFICSNPSPLYQKPISGRNVPYRQPRNVTPLTFLQLHMLRSAIGLTCRRRTSRFPFSTSVLPLKATVVRREGISTMVAPKYLTGDKASIDKFIDQFDVSCPFQALEKKQ